MTTGLCGDEQLWNSTQFLSSSWPKTTSCFRLSILVWLPCGWLWLALPTHLYFLFWRHKGGFIATNALNLAKTILSAALCILSITEIVRKGMSATSHDRSLAPVEWQAFGVSFTSYLLTVFLIHIERIGGLTTSCVLWIFWCLSVFTNIVPFYSNICLQEYQKDPLLFSVFYIKFVCLLVHLVLATLVDKSAYMTLYTSPELSATVPSRLFLWWTSSFIFKTYREGLQEETMLNLHPRDEAARVVPQFEKPWREELQQHQQGLNGHFNGDIHGYSSFESIKNNSSAEESTPLISHPSQTNDRKRIKKPSLLKVLVKTYTVEVLQSHFLMLVFDLLQFANPLLLGTLIDHAREKRLSSEETQAWPGYVIALGFFIVGLVSSVSLNQCYHLGMTLGMRVKDALSVAVFKKSLTSPRPASKKVKVEETVSLMSMDCQRMQDLVGYLWMLWSVPLEITIASVLLWREVGPSMLWGIFVMVILMPINAYVAYRQKKNLTELANVKSRRLKLTKELVEGIQVYKMFTWERNFQHWIERIRSEEIKILKKGYFNTAISTLCWASSPFLVLLATLANYAMSSHSTALDAHKVFVCLALFNILRFPVNLLPMLFTLLYQSIFTVDRLNKYLTSESVRASSSPDVFPDNEFAIQVERGHFSWDKSPHLTTLSSIDLHIPAGSLVAIVGQSGSGKSSLLSAIMGDVDRLHGSVKVKSANILHLPQQAWVQSSSIKDNVLFGKVKNMKRYARVMDACCLKPEVDLLPRKDKTEMGERGVFLNDSEKQRVALARAVYSKADIYLLDEPIGDVDSTTANQIFSNVISKKGLLRNATRLVVTGNVHWLSQADVIVMMTDGRVSETGTYNHLLARDGHFVRYLRISNPSQFDVGNMQIFEDATESLSLEESLWSDVGFSPADDFLASMDSMNSSHQRKFELTESTAVEDDIRERERRIREMLLAEEKTEITRIKLSVFWHYFQVIGFLSATLSFIFFLIYQGVNLFSNIWLAIWTQHEEGYHIGHIDSSSGNSSHLSHKSHFYLGIYGTLGVIQAAFVITFSVIFSHGMTSVSRILHGQVLSKVVRSPIAFFDQMPPARLLNRFSRDVDVLDTRLPLHLRTWMNTFFGTICTIVIISYCTPVFLALVVPLGLLYYVVQMLYIPTSRQLKNLESTSRTSVHALFRDAITGVLTIQTFNASERFTTLFLEKIEKNSGFHFASIATNRWLAICVEMLGTLVVFGTALFCIGVGQVNESLVGLSMAFALQATSAFSWMIRALTDLETNIYSVQRMREMAQIAPELPRINPFKRPQATWPQQGAIHFFNCTTQPRPDLYPALKPLNLYIAGGEKIGIVGKFRSEALSIRDALFRIVEATSGSIIIDNTIISDIGLLDLRSRMTFLPGDPVVFLGTLRMNLDPKSIYTDDDVWLALEMAGIKESFADHHDGLKFDCGDKGSSLSLKQHHQVNLARALLHRSRILIMEESIRVLDPDIEELIQTTVRAQFQDCTVLAFAYRVNTIVDYDRVMVLDEGVMVEVDNPQVLLRNPMSSFYRMARDANLVS